MHAQICSGSSLIFTILRSFKAAGAKESSKRCISALQAQKYLQKHSFFV